MIKDIEKVLVSEEELDKKTTELAEIISKEYEGKDLFIIGILKGGVVFTSDLIKKITIPMQVDFMAVSSYKGAKSSGVVKIIKDLDDPIDGKDLLIVEDILDSGRTLSYLKEILSARNPNSIKICTLFDKPDRREAEIHADYIGAPVPNEFIVGYGLDYNEYYRNLPYIGVLKKSVYSEE